MRISTYRARKRSAFVVAECRREALKQGSQWAAVGQEGGRNKRAHFWVAEGICTRQFSQLTNVNENSAHLDLEIERFTCAIGLVGARLLVAQFLGESRRLGGGDFSAAERRVDLAACFAHVRLNAFLDAESRRHSATYAKQGELGVQLALCGRKHLVVGGEIVVGHLDIVEIGLCKLKAEGAKNGKTTYPAASWRDATKAVNIGPHSSLPRLASPLTASMLVMSSSCSCLAVSSFFSVVM